MRPFKKKTTREEGTQTDSEMTSLNPTTNVGNGQKASEGEKRDFWFYFKQLKCLLDAAKLVMACYECVTDESTLGKLLNLELLKRNKQWTTTFKQLALAASG
ncbi:uncharacterized protein LOC126375954 [Pectinophora gossypiella]|uniref:uncharacterized protein LOC126375954 n=1 Tax=Pectinophora gossypiella TaxID=13191 RepID=UPI00214E3455|nr:uncharacterized protein LOC126375954 [Pectinophora gossypiella]